MIGRATLIPDEDQTTSAMGTIDAEGKLPYSFHDEAFWSVIRSGAGA
jgi:hypothetical protein